MTDFEARGIIPRAVSLLFEAIANADPALEFTLKVSIVEICESLVQLPGGLAPLGHRDPSYAPLLVRSDLTLTLTLTPLPPFPLHTSLCQTWSGSAICWTHSRPRLTSRSVKTTHTPHAPCHAFRLLDHTCL